MARWYWKDIPVDPDDKPCIPDDDETAMRAYVSELWAEDWNCPEDSAYDDDAP